MKNLKKRPINGEIFGIKLTSSSQTILLKKIEGFIDSTSKNKLKTKHKNKHKMLITTPNPEQLILAHKNEEIGNLIATSDFRLCDGKGLAMAVKFLALPRTDVQIFKPILYLLQGITVGMRSVVDSKWLESDQRVIKGREFFLELVKLANERKWKVFLLGGSKKVSQKSLNLLKKKYSKVIFKATSGPKLAQNGVPVGEKDLLIEKKAISAINNFGPDILFVGFGSPKQERWMMRNTERLKYKTAMLLGGTFDYLAGKRKKVPLVVEKLGMEWFWRLLTGSQKPNRIINAVIRFPLLVYLQKISIM